MLNIKKDIYKNKSLPVITIIGILINESKIELKMNNTILP